ncbi:MAG: hypothetical protein HY690_03925 [Chloroflexi bacterium]|nr:hypothetical protein [Chloroflexota bacterium]
MVIDLPALPTSPPDWSKQHVSSYRSVYAPPELELQGTASPRMSDLGSVLGEITTPVEYEEVWHLAGRISDTLVLRHSVRVVLRWEADAVVADQEDLNLHAFGDDRMTALASLADCIAEDYERIVSSNVRLSPRMQQLRSRLSEVIVVSSAGQS